jgi:cation:H+ antiporter
MAVSVLLFLVGTGVLYLGAEAMVKGAATLALRYGLRPLVVGLTVVALGTSMPEFVINFLSVLSEEDALALGNIIGSNICNIALILGASSVVLPLSVDRAMLHKEYPMMLGAMLAFYLLSLDGTISQVDGLLLVIGLVGFLLFVVIDASSYNPLSSTPDPEGISEDVSEEIAAEVGDDDDESGNDSRAPEEIAEIEASDLQSPMRTQVAYLTGGMVGLAGGAHLMVDRAVVIAEYLGVSEVVIGLTIVALGTSLPELAASVVSAVRGESELSMGNALGSNLLNVLFVVGVVSMMRPLDVSDTSLDVHLPVMLGFAVLLFPLAWTGYRITRLEGSLMVAGFLGYMSYLVYPYV